MSVIKKLQNRIIVFRNKRNWGHFHKPKDLSLSLVLEATEVLELFQWKTDKQAEDYLATGKGRKAIEEELSDVLFWLLLIAFTLNIDLEEAFERKMKKNERKYPVRKSKGKATKYTDL